MTCPIKRYEFTIKIKAIAAALEMQVMPSLAPSELFIEFQWEMQMIEILKLPH